MWASLVQPLAPVASGLMQSTASVVYLANTGIRMSANAYRTASVSLEDSRKILLHIPEQDVLVNCVQTDLRKTLLHIPAQDVISHVLSVNLIQLTLVV